jgi:3-deoxy-D-manno-octulosonate 8-phosphate phosphatase (KDO 8-P phosphatase)
VSASEQLAAMQALVMDVDGVLTDGTFSWSDSGEESKRFSFEDIMGLSIARKAGIVLGLISGEDGVLVDRLASKIGAASVAKGCKDKAKALWDFSLSTSIPLERIAYIGDDINDLPALAIAGLSAAPANAQRAVKESVAIVLERGGGQGAVRQLVELMLKARNVLANRVGAS